MGIGHHVGENVSLYSMARCPAARKVDESMVVLRSDDEVVSGSKRCTQCAVVFDPRMQSGKDGTGTFAFA